MENKKNNFLFHRNWWDALRDEGNDLLGAFIRNLCEHAFEGEEKEPLPELRLTIRHARTEMDKDAKRYVEICEKNRKNVLNRWQKRNTTEYDRIRPNTSCTDNDNDNDNELSLDNLFNKVKRKENNYGDYNTPQDNIANAQNKHIADIAQSVTQADERSREVHAVLPFG